MALSLLSRSPFNCIFKEAINPVALEDLKDLITGQTPTFSFIFKVFLSVSLHSNLSTIIDDCTRFGRTPLWDGLFSAL